MTNPPAIAKCKVSTYTRRDQQAFAARSNLDYVGPAEVQKEFANGQQLINRRIISEVYSFSAPSYGEFVFDVRGIKDMFVAGKLDFKMFDAEMLGSAWYDHVMSKGGVERWRIDQLNGKDLRRPGILVIFDGQMQALIDGNHRLCARYERGSRTFRYAATGLRDVIEARCACRPGQEHAVFGSRHTHELDGAEYIGGTYTKMTSDDFKKRFPNGVPE